jgi:hypothetical protein
MQPILLEFLSPDTTSPVRFELVQLGADPTFTFKTKDSMLALAKASNQWAKKNSLMLESEYYYLLQIRLGKIQLILDEGVSGLDIDSINDTNSFFQEGPDLMSLLNETEENIDPIFLEKKQTLSSASNQFMPARTAHPLPQNPNDYLWVGFEHGELLKWSISKKCVLQHFGPIMPSCIYSLTLTKDKKTLFVADSKGNLKQICTQTDTIKKDYGKIHSDNITSTAVSEKFLCTGC